MKFLYTVRKNYSFPENDLWYLFFKQLFCPIVLQSFHEKAIYKHQLPRYLMYMIDHHYFPLYG